MAAIYLKENLALLPFGKKKPVLVDEL